MSKRRKKKTKPPRRQWTDRRITVVGAIVNLLLAALKFTLGIMGRSQALVADAVHSLTDLLSDVLVLCGLYVAALPRDQNHPYGHGKVQSLGSLAVALLLLLTAGGMAWSALNNIAEETATRPTLLAAVGALLTILIKEILFRATIRVGRRDESPLLIANAWHHRTDALSSVAALIGIVGASQYEQFWFLDAVAALFVVLFIGRAALVIGLDAVKELMDTQPATEILTSIRTIAEKTRGVEGVHDVRARSYGSYLMVDLDIEVNPNITVAQGHRTSVAVREKIVRVHRRVIGVQIHVDPAGEHEKKNTTPKSKGK
jgi:cation diffusion facilitator family transporter